VTVFPGSRAKPFFLVIPRSEVRNLLPSPEGPGSVAEPVLSGRPESRGTQFPRGACPERKAAINRDTDPSLRSG